MQLGKDLEGWHHSGPATCKNNSQVSAWLRFGTCGQRGKEEEQEHPAFPYVTFLDLSLSGWINPWAGPGDDGCSQPEECRGMTGARVVHEKALRTSGTSPRDKSPPVGDGPALCRSQTKVKRKKKGKLPCERVKKTFYLGKRTSLEGWEWGERKCSELIIYLFIVRSENAFF